MRLFRVLFFIDVGLICLGKITIFEMLNIRLIMVIFLIAIAMSASSVIFNILVRPLYKKTGQKEYYLPMIYHFVPIAMATMIFVVTLVNGMHYRAELAYDRGHEVTLRKEYANDFANKFYEIINKYINISDNIVSYMDLISGNRYNLNDYIGIISRYLSTRYVNDNNIRSFSIFLSDIENANVNITGENIENISLIWQYDIDNLITINTNLRPNIPANNMTKLLSGTNSVVNMNQNNETFYIYTPIVLDNNNVGFVSLEVGSSIYIDILTDLNVRNNLNIFITDLNYSINLSNNPALIGDMQRELENKVSAGYLKDSKNDSFIESIMDVNVIHLADSDTYAIKYLLFDSIYIINTWQHEIAYKENTLFRSTIVKSSISIYFSKLSLFFSY